MPSYDYDNNLVDKFNLILFVYTPTTKLDKLFIAISCTYIILIDFTTLIINIEHIGAIITKFY